METQRLLSCSNCGTRSPRGTQYCPQCGEAVDPHLIEELRWLYGALRDLDSRVEQGQGDRSLLDLRAEYRARYLAIRHAPSASAAAVTGAASTEASKGTMQSPQASPVWPAAQQTPAPLSPIAPVSRPHTPSPEPVPFSWQAFVADQAIAIMAYLGGFLLLVATLTFEVGAWQIADNVTLNNRLKLAIICVVYVVFGVLGFFLRRTSLLRTVGRAYLGVFALMTPLVALAAYLYALQDLGISRAGMLTISALYAAVVYLALAWRTQFATYAYLGWVALLVGGLAAVQWAAAPTEWNIFVLGAISCVLLVPHRLRRRASFAILAGPALHLGTLTSLMAALAIPGLALTIWLDLLLHPGQPLRFATDALAASAVALLALGIGWSVTLRDLERRAPPEQLDALNLLTSAAVMFAVVSIAIWQGATIPGLAVLLTALALVEGGAAMALGQLRPERSALRGGLERLAFGTATFAALNVLLDAGPNWPLLAALLAGVLLATAIAVRDRAPNWLLASAPFLLIAGARIAADIRTSVAAAALYALRPELLLAPTLYALIALVLVGVGILLHQHEATRDYALRLHVVALAAALLATILLPLESTMGSTRIMPQPDYQTTLLALFALSALAAGIAARRPSATALTAGIFGLLLPLPYLPSSDGLTPSLLAVALCLLVLLLRPLAGRTAALPLYGIALWAVVTSTVHAAVPGVSTASWSSLGITFAAWELLLVATIATVAALIEAEPLVTTLAALLALSAVPLIADPVARVVVMFVLIGTGALFAYLRGRAWSVAWYGAGVLASLLAVDHLRGGVTHGPYWEVGVLITLVVLAYLLSVQQRTAWGTALATGYGIWAALALPEPRALEATLILTFAAALVGGLLRLRFGREWALAMYGVALGASLVAVARVTPYDAGVVETLLLAFVAVACVLAALERSPVAGLFPAAYAIWAVILEPSTHTLLVFALVAAAVALALGRFVGQRWSLPWYAVAAVAGTAVGIRGTPDAGFEALALLALALAAYLVAAVESLPDLLPLAFLLGTLALGAGASWAQLLPWQTVLAFIALCYLYAAGRWLWRAIPWLRPRDGRAVYRALGGSFGDALWTALRGDDPRALGVAVHTGSSFVLALGTLAVAIVTLHSFTPQATETQAVAIGMLATGGLLAAQAWLDDRRALWYVAGQMLALAVTWEARWLGADNLQAFIIAPGSYQLLIGALLPGDKRLGYPTWLGRWASLSGALVLLIPTLYQALTSGQELLYGSVMAVEAVLVVLIGVGTRSRVVTMVAVGFVGFAAIRGAMLAVSEGTPVWVVIATLAVLLMGAATWLSLRSRNTTPDEPGQMPVTTGE